MAFPAPVPADSASNLPCCATSHLYSIGGLHYYATVDCDSGETGTGVSGSLITPKGCDGDTCDAGSIVSPRIASSVAAARSSFLGGQQHPFRRTMSKELLKKLRLDLNFLRKRPSTAAGGTDGVAARRRNMATYLIGADDISGELANIDELPHDLRDAFFTYVHQELIKVRIDEATSSSKGFVVLDKDLDKDTIPFGELEEIGSPTTAPSDPTKVTYFRSSTEVSVTNALFKTPGAGDPLTPFIHLKVRRHAVTGSPADQDVYFRIQKVTRTTSSSVVLFEHYVGQQIGEAHLKWGSPSVPVPKNKIVDAKWIDRHSHFHVIEATPNGGTTQQILVYSSLDMAAGEQFT